MARRPATSQPRATQSSQSQSQRPNGSQRYPRSQRHGQADDEDEDDDGEQEYVEDGNEKAGADLDALIDRKANALVRLALFNECKRSPLRREEINKKVLGTHTRLFNGVLAKANSKLQAFFGMELVELMSRNEREKDFNANEIIRDEENATGIKKKSASAGSKSYILRSNLVPELIELAAISNHLLLNDEIDEIEEDEDEDAPPQSYGSILSWSTSDQLGALGVTYVILALILLNGRVLSDMEMKKHLKSLRLEPGSHIFLPKLSTHPSIQIDAFMSQLVRQGYLDKIKVAAAGAPRPTQGKRGRAPAADEEGASYEWRWGSRAQTEVGEVGIGQFVGEFMVERALRERAATQSDDDDDENAKKRKGKRMDPEEEKMKMLETVMKGIGKAVGGKLSDVK